ncbi:hypothetical protein HY639_01825 [Candidatus Woesearchaeota archaeon]|nr:hypothetical protein [Candidatus Woesearchaeota archaeon]
MGQTTPEDTIWLQRLQNLAFAMSGHQQRLFTIAPLSNIPEYYAHRLSIAEKPSDVYHNLEMVQNYPTLRQMLAMESNGTLAKQMVTLYTGVKAKQPNMPCGMIADLIVCSLYLQFSFSRTAKIVT